MDVLTTEEQQVEAIKKWWKENWASVVGGALVGVALIVGYRTWQTSRDAEAAAASAVYEAMIGNMMTERNDEALNLAGTLLSNYGDSAYAAYASLVSARVKLAQGDADSARVHLQWVLDNSDDDALKDVAALRLARLLLVQKEYDKALAAINGRKDLGSLGEELRGDALVGKGDSGNARLAYVKAIADAEAGDRTRRDYLQMKVDRLGES